MATRSSILLLAELALGESGVLGYANWGEAALDNFRRLEAAVGQTSSIAVTSANVTLTDEQERALYIKVTGTLTGNRSVLTNDRKGFWIVHNGTSGAFSLTFKTASGSGVVIPQGGKAVLVSDGTDVLPVAIVSNATATLLDANSGLNASNLSSGTVPSARVAGSYTGITGTGALDAGSITSGFGSIDNGSSAITTTGTVSGGTVRATNTASSAGFRIGTTTGETVVSNNGVFAREGGTLNFRPNGAGSSTSQMTYDTSGNLTVAGSVIAPAGTEAAPSLTFAGDTNTGISSGGADIIRFSTGGTTRAKISASGVLHVGNEAYTGDIGAVGTAISAGGVAVTRTGLSSAPIGTNKTNSDGGDQIAFYVAGALKGYIGSNASQVFYNETSDARLKENFRDFDSGALIDQMAVYHYDWKAGGEGFGPKAQELINVFPLAVSPGEGEPGDPGFRPWSWDASKTVPLLIREIQSLRARLAAAGL
jgi:hypothetical protein